MVERQEIDALLVSALYGELTPADEARLTQHLESHPTDRAVLADLTRARAAVRDSRIFEVQLEPPQAVSALLLQEAARRARKINADKPSWFARFLHSMLAHPAMAAATMLVVVVGVAGTLYLRSGESQFADQTVATGKDNANRNGELKQEEAVTTPPAPAVVADPAPSDAAIRLVEKNADKAVERKADGKATADDYGVDLHESVSKRTQVATKPADPRADALRRQRDQKTANGIVVRSTSTEMQPRELENEKAKLATNDSRGDLAGAGAGPATGAGSAAPGFADTNTRRAATSRTPAPGRVEPKPEAKAPVAAQAAPPPAAPTSPAPAPAQTVRAEDKKTEQQRKADEDQAWAQAQLGRAIQLAKAGKCQQVGQVAVTIANRAPEFYQQNVVENRELKNCGSYINAAREKEQEQRAKSRPAKKASPNAMDAPAANQ